MHRSAGHDLCAGRDAADDRHVAIRMHDRLPRAHVPVKDQRVRLFGPFRLRRGGGALLGIAGALTLRPPATTGGKCGPTSAWLAFSPP